MSTSQTSYQKLIAMQMYLLLSLPDSIISDLLLEEPGCLVVCRDGDSRLAEYPCDKRLECNVRVVKEALGMGAWDPLQCVACA